MHEIRDIEQMENRMNQRESSSLKSIERSDTIVWPESPEVPLIHVSENEEDGLYIASFEFALTSVHLNGRGINNKDNHGNERRLDWDRYIGSLLDGMSNDQELQIICKSGSRPDGMPFFNWAIRGISRASFKGDALEEAVRLYQGLNVVLKTLEESYCLVPVTRTEDMIEHSGDCCWQAYIEPTPVMLDYRPRTGIGFHVGQDSIFSAIRIILPINDAKKPRQYFDAVVSGSKVCPAHIMCAISISPVRLSSDELDKIRTVYGALPQGRVDIIKAGEKIARLPEEKSYLTAIMNKIHNWLEKRHGFRVACFVMSPLQIPMTLLTMIGGEVFPGSSLSVKMIKGPIQSEHKQDETQPSAIEVEGNTINLRACLNGGVVLPPLFPRTSLLIECGVEKSYVDASPSSSVDGILVGYSGKQTIARDVRFPESDRSRHCYIVGATGVGKSTLLNNMIFQDIKNGKGVTVIDPHGDLYRQVLEGAIPRTRLRDVILVDPCDFEYSVGINFLECSRSRFRAVEVNYVVNEMIKIFDRLYDLRQTGGPIFEQYMRNALLLLLENESWIATLVDVPRVFEERSFRKFLLKTCTNPLVVSFWKKQAETAGGDASLSNIAPYITSKLNQFTTNAVLRPIVGQTKSTINFRETIDTGKILLVNLSKGLLGELDAQLLGMLIIGKLFSSAMGRVTIEKKARKAMFLYVDEFQNFTTDSVAYLISEARKFGLNLTLANQNLSQLSTNSGKHNILDAVLGNVGSMLLFRLGVIDSEKLEAYTRPELRAGDLQQLPDFHVAARMLTQNKPQKPFVFKTAPMPEAHDNCNPDDIIDVSRARYTVEKSIIEENIKKRIETSGSDGENV